MSDTDIYRRNHPDIPPRILFVGRTRLIQDADGLRVQSRIQVISALSRIETAFVKQYGPIPYRSDVSYLVIEQPISHLPFYLMTDAFQYLEAILKDIIDKNQDIIIAVNGWEGLTTDTLSFYGIFARRASHVTLCVYGSDPPSETNINAKFYRADVLQMCQVFFGIKEENSLDTSTSRVLWYFKAWPRVEIEWTQMWPHLRHDQDKRPY